MAFVTPIQRGDGYVVDASEYNKNIVDNVIALRTGALAIASQAAGDVVTASSATQFSRVAPGTAGMVLTSNGAGVGPSFKQGGDVVSALSDVAAPALDAALGNVFTLAATGNRTIGVPSNATNGQKIVIRHLASGGARTLALNSGAGGFRFGTDITALSETASGKTDYIGCVYSSIDSFWDVVAYSKGY